MALTKKLAWSPRVLRAESDSVETGYVSVGELHVDERYQRWLEDARVDAIVETYDPLQMEPLVVNRRGDGTYYVIDGQHRLAALRKLGREVALCVIHDGLDDVTEARLFLRLNTDRRAVNPWGKYKARLHSKDPVALAIARVVEEAGLKTGTPTRTIGHVAAVAALEKIYKAENGPALLRLVLDRAVALWAGDIRAYDGVFLLGLAMFFHSWIDSIDTGRFDSIFGVTPADDVFKRARRLCTEEGYAMGGTVIALALRDIYNGKVNRQKGRIVGPPLSLSARRTVGWVRKS